MSTTSRTSKATALAHLQALMAGTNKHFPNASFMLDNTTYSAASIVALLQSHADAIAASEAAHASARDAVLALRAAEARVGPVTQAYKRLLRTMFGKATQTLADFGVQPARERTPLTSAQNAAAVAKRKATRAARGTVGKKKKLAVKGDVTGVVVTPVVAVKVATNPAAPGPTVPPSTIAGAPPPPAVSMPPAPTMPSEAPIPARPVEG